MASKVRSSVEETLKLWRFYVGDLWEFVISTGKRVREKTLSRNAIFHSLGTFSKILFCVNIFMIYLDLIYLVHNICLSICLIYEMIENEEREIPIID